MHDNNWKWPKAAPLLLSLRAGRTATCGAIAAQQRPAGTSTIVVLGGLLEDADRMAGDLATALERSRIAGLACEAVVDGMKPP